MGIKTDLLIGLIVVGIIVLIAAIIIASVILALKSVGLLLIIFGIFMMFFFPGAGEYQESWMASTGVIIGVICVILGIVLLFF